MSGTTPLDARIAERVMGWRPLGPHWSDVNHSGYDYATQDGTFVELPPFSTDIAAAWRVVERMHFGFMDGGAITDAAYARFMRAVYHDIQEPGLFQMEAKWAAYHICLAALDAIGAKPSAQPVAAGPAQP